MNTINNAAAGVQAGNPFYSASGIKEKRSVLCKLSAQAKQIIADMRKRASGDVILPNVNEVLISMYRKTEGVKDFKSYREWMREGKQVQKGAKCYVLWSTPIEKKEEDKNKEEVREHDNEKFYALSFVFSSNQVK